jgi:hypothetical protein
MAAWMAEVRGTARRLEAELHRTGYDRMHTAGQILLSVEPEDAVKAHIPDMAAAVATDFLPNDLRVRGYLKTGSSQLRVWWGLARRSLIRRRGLPGMEVLTLPIWETSWNRTGGVTTAGARVRSATVVRRLAHEPFGWRPRP